MHWICQHFCTNPIVSIDLGEVAPHTNACPAVAYRLTLKNGTKLEGLLPMNWDAREERWFGAQGLDWHLHPSAKATPEAKL